MKTAELSNIRKNIMGTTSFDMKAGSMRKAQEFIVYPLDKGQDGHQIKAQSDNYMAVINLQTGEGELSGRHSHAGFMALQLDRAKGKTTEFNLSNLDTQAIRMQVFASAGNRVGNKVVKIDNSGASNVLSGV